MSSGGRRDVCNRAIKCSRVFTYRGISGVQAAGRRLRLCLRDAFFQKQPVRRLQALELDCIAAIKVGRGQLLHLTQNAVGEQCQALRSLDCQGAFEGLNIKRYFLVVLGDGAGAQRNQ